MFKLFKKKKKKKKACNTCIRIDTFKIKYNFYHKNINNQSNYFVKKVNVYNQSHIKILT